MLYSSQCALKVNTCITFDFVTPDQRQTGNSQIDTTGYYFSVVQLNLPFLITLDLVLDSSYKQ